MSTRDESLEELLMAYADGELEGAEHAAERAKVETAMNADPDVARRIEKHRALRQRLGATFDRVLEEPVPDRLIAAVRGAQSNASATPGARGSAEGRLREAPAPRAATGATSSPGASSSSTVVDFKARSPAANAEATDRLSRSRTSWSWPQWGAMAASLVIGAIIGRLALNSPELSPIAARDGHLVAQAGLAEALSNQLASAQSPNAPVQIGTSFKAKSGAFCRTFVLHEGDTVGGLACRAGGEWNVHALARATATPGAEGGYRPAGSELPAPVLAAVEGEISGDPLDSSGEARAKASGWK